MIVSFILFFILLFLGFWEAYSHKKRVEKIKIRILVNGTRGKTTVSRVLVAALNRAGIKTMGRTTGSEAVIITPSLETEKIVRKRKANILEMKDFFRRAAKEECECVVVECMALFPENQLTMATSLVKPTIVVITNSYIDHIAEMGRKREDTVYALSLSVPKNASLYTLESDYDSLPNKVIHPKEVYSLPQTSFPLHKDSWRISKALLNDLGLSNELIISSLSTIIPDVGMMDGIVSSSGSIFYPYFSVNDEECMERNLREIREREGDKKIAIIFNNREDREYRIELMRDILKKDNTIADSIYVIGDYPRIVVRALRKYISIEAIDINAMYKKIEEEKDMVFVGLGNIKGSGEELIALFTGEEK